MTSQHQPLPVLLTRPLAQSARFADWLQRRFGADVSVIISPIMRLEFLEPVLPEGDFRILILTSETGVEAAIRLRNAGKPIPQAALCVGDHTAAIARAAGFAADSAHGDAEALIAMVLAGDVQGPFLHLRGHEARGDIAPRLSAKGHQAAAVIVYEQIEEPLSGDAVALLGGSGPVIVPVFSPRSATLLAEQGPFAAPLWVVAISRAAAKAAAGLGAQRIVTADRPDGVAMLDAIATVISEAAS